ncbi:type II toxin-antitoxin system VapC family toxin [Candidatus Roizmanbacteria bacterium]|nr:type II toxin-antitoxin system VapC family toxin [Candidatus Roizmanbacteria bacterium]
MKIVVDTNIIIDYLRGGTAWEEFLTHADPKAELYLSTLVVFELFSGKITIKTEVAKKIHAFLSYFEKVDVTEKIAERAGKIYRDISCNLDVPDYIVAATALEMNAAVLTLNKKHFSQIPELRLLDITNVSQR